MIENGNVNQFTVMFDWKWNVAQQLLAGHLHAAPRCDTNSGGYFPGWGMSLAAFWKIFATVPSSTVWIESCCCPFTIF